MINVWGRRPAGGWPNVFSQILTILPAILWRFLQGAVSARSTLDISICEEEIFQKLQSHSNTLAQTIPGEEVEFWFARDLQEPLGYARWENFITAIYRAIESCKTVGYDPNDHFHSVTKKITLGKGAERTIEDFMLTRLLFN